MSNDQLDSAEASLFADIAGNLHNMDRHAEGGEKSGLKSKHTMELIKKLGSSGVQSPRRPSSSIPEIPTEGAGLEPIRITEEMMKDAEMVDGDMNAIKHPEAGPSMEIPKDISDLASQVNLLEQQQIDPNQLELGFGLIKAEDVYNEISDLTSQVKALRKELREIKTCLKQSE